MSFIPKSFKLNGRAVRPAQGPPLAAYPGGHLAACHHPLNVSDQEIAGATRSPLSPASSGSEMPNGKEATDAKPMRNGTETPGE